MALSATIYKANISVSNMDQDYYARHHLTLARHPSETLERLMLRLSAFALHASETLHFSRGLSANEEPELLKKNNTEDIELWVELGEPDEKRLKKACSRSELVVLYSYGGRASEVWWRQIKHKVARLNKLSVFRISPETLSDLADICQRSMQLSATIQDGQLWLAVESRNIFVELIPLK